MKKQTVMWTALPNGVVGSRLRLSVFVSPRLETDEILPGNTTPTLGQFPDFLEWPEKTLEFSVRFDGSPALPADRVSAPPSLKLWQALFDAKTYVEPYKFKGLHDRLIRSYPVKHVVSFLKDQYQHVALESPTEFPSVEGMTKRRKSLFQIGFYEEEPRPGLAALPTNREARLVGELEQTLARNKAIPPSETPDPPKDFLQLKLFHRPLNAPDPAKPGEYKRAKIEIPDIDFHQMVSSLGDYPELLRKMGLVIDLEVPLPAGVPPSTRVWVEVSWSPVAGLTTINVTPKTKCTLNGGFRAEPQGDELTNGMLRLRDPSKPAEFQPYDVVQVDPDGAALKAMDFASNLMRRMSPTHRTADTPENASFPSMQSAGISLAKMGRAFELVQAFQKARLNNNAAETSPPLEVTLYAEDIVRGYHVDIRDGQSGKWHSLCRRVGHYEFVSSGTSLEIEDEGFISMSVTESADGSSPDLYLPESLFRWAGWSLVAPRPGLRIGLENEPEEFENEDPTDFGLETNFEAAPKSLPRLRFGTRYQIRARAVDLAGNSLTLEEADGLMALPLAEHVTTDKSFTYLRFEPLSSPAVVLRRRVKESPGESLERLVIHSYNDAPPKDSVPTEEDSQRHIAPPLGSQLMAETHKMFDTATGMDKNAYSMIIEKEGTLSAGEDPLEEQVHNEAQLQLPYLPDPVARGTALFGLPGAATKATQVAFDGKWPETKPFRIRIVEGKGKPKWNATSRVLTVLLPKAELARVKLSSYLSEEDLKLMGMWRWIEESSAPAAKKAELHKHALEGRHWMITPFREIVLVHAVQQPLKAPKFDYLKGIKNIGATYAMLYAEVPISGKSTSKLDLEAEWDEPIDALAEPTWQTIPGQAHVCEFPVEPEDDVVKIARQRHEFGDTKYRKVNYTAVATTRFRDYFPFTDEQIESGEVKITRESAKFPLDILSSARPAAPKVLYVIPTFGWERKKLPKGLASKRSGGGLRVYMERPWFSSGDGELLGVVIPQASPGRLTALGRGIPSLDKLKPYVTLWGADPIWRSTATTTAPSLQDFRNATASETGLTLDELQGVKVSVAGHAVEYDPDRQLWYCDIEIDPGQSYYPFIRLALARYQPMSVKTGTADVKLSRIMLADFAQLAPDRIAGIVFDASDAKLLTVSVAGPTYSASAAGRGGSEVEVTVETRRPDIEGDLGWTPVPDAVSELPQGAVRAKGRIWTGKVTLPEPRGSKPFRLVIKEYERFRVAGPPVALLGMTSIPATERRVVYAEALEI